MSTPAARRVEALEARLADVEARNERLESIVAALLAARGPRDPADAMLLGVLAGSTCGHWVTVGEVLEATAVDPELARALAAADISGPLELGQWLSRMRDVTVSGFVLTRGARGASGRRWRCRAC
jgi:hypothetical protein